MEEMSELMDDRGHISCTPEITTQVGEKALTPLLLQIERRKRERKTKGLGLAKGFKGEAIH